MILSFSTVPAVLWPRPQSAHEEGVWSPPLFPTHQSVRDGPQAGLHFTAHLHLQGVKDVGSLPDDTHLWFVMVHCSWWPVSPLPPSFPAHFSKGVLTCALLSAMRSWSVVTPSWAPFAAMQPICSTSSWRATLTTRAASLLSGRTYRWDSPSVDLTYLQRIKRINQLMFLGPCALCNSSKNTFYINTSWPFLNCVYKQDFEWITCYRSLLQKVMQ